MAGISYYAVVRYVPDPVRDERINIGVVVASGTGEFIGARFAHDLQRAKSFGAEDVGFLKDFAKTLDDLTIQPRLRLKLGGAPEWDVQTLRTFHERWGNSIQFSEPRAAQEPEPDKLLEAVFARYVSAPRQREHRVRDRRWVVAQAVEHLRAEARERFPEEEVSHIIKRSQQITGAFDSHTFPLLLQRDGSAHAVEALSFEGEDTDKLAREVDATAWTIDDVRKAKPDLPITILTLEKEESNQFLRAARIYVALHANVVTSRDLGEWAQHAVRALADVSPAGR
jgi:hypothetical protein